MIVRLLVLLCCVTLSVACQRVVDGAPAPASFLDTLPLGLDRVRQISDFDRLERVADSDQPWSDPTSMAGPCHALFDGRAAYGDTWSAFRRVADEADLNDGPLSPIVSVGQYLVAYSDPDVALRVLNRRVDDATACTASNTPGLSGTVTRLDDDTAVWLTDGLATVYAVRSAILVETAVVGLPDAERIASELSHALLERIP